MSAKTVQSYVVSFDGRLLDRGFWLYVWRVRASNREVWYVGRTGDNPSHNAASPFGRLSQHLDLRPAATANMLVRNLRGCGMNASKCTFRLLSIGPLFPEQDTLEKHKPLRDKTALLEAELAEFVRSTGRTVIGKHPRRGAFDHRLFTQVKRRVNDFLLRRNGGCRP